MSEHEAVGNGWPHDEYGNPFLRDYGEGCARCTCGKLSAPGDGTFRKHWIAMHRRLEQARQR